MVLEAVEVAHYFNVSDVIIGLTIVGIGTLLPELISSIIAVRKYEHELVIGNIVGSNLFNTLAVVGIAVVIHGITFLYRDGLLMLGLTVALLIFCLGIRGLGKTNRFTGLVLLLCFVGYNAYLVFTQF